MKIHRLAGLAAAVFCAPLFAFLGGAEPNRCVACHGNLPPAGNPQPAPPRWNRSFSLTWKMFELAERPPLSHPGGTFIPGQTFYDWDLQSMTEIYPEKCMDIFPDGRDFPCQFISQKEKTFLVRFKTQAPHEVDSCCRWSDSDFWAPRPDVLRNMLFDKVQALGQQMAEWWIWDIPLPGPFGYATMSGSNMPGAFWFPVISGWVQQDFSDYSPAKPNPKYFQLPEVCRENVPICKGS